MVHWHSLSPCAKHKRWFQQGTMSLTAVQMQMALASFETFDREIMIGKLKWRT